MGRSSKNGGFGGEIVKQMQVLVVESPVNGGFSPPFWKNTGGNAVQKCVPTHQRRYLPYSQLLG